MRITSLWSKRRNIALVTAVVLAGSLGVPAALANSGDNVQTSSVVPAAPRNLILTPERTSTDGHVELDWTASTSSDISEYEVYRWYGSGTPAADERSFVASTESIYYSDFMTSEGDYRFAVRAVSTAGKKSALTPWVRIAVDLPENGRTIAPDTKAPAAPTELVADREYVRDGLVDLSWTAPEDEDLWRYLIYRATGSGTATFVDYVEADVSYYTDELAEDGAYTYHVVAQDLAGNLSKVSNTAKVTMDTVNPVVEITAPNPDLTYRPEGSLVVTTRITEKGAGYAADAVEYLLNGKRLTSGVIRLVDLAEGYHTLEVVVTDRAGNVGSDVVDFYVSRDLADDAPVMLTESGFTRNRTVTFKWDAPYTSGVTGYNIYRALGDGKDELIGTTAASVRTYSDTVASDGIWSYYVVARYNAAKGGASGTVAFTVDQKAPTVTITSPEQGKSYKNQGKLTVAVKVTDGLSGVASEDIKVQLDGKSFTGTSIDLAKLAEGDHAIRVSATDRAGNVGTASVRFQVSATADDGDDDEDDDEDDDDKSPVDPAFQAKVLKTLEKWQSKIHHGQYNALRAKAQSGNWFSFTKHVQKHQGKFIHPDAAQELLSLFGLGDTKKVEASDGGNVKPGNGNSKPGNGNNKPGKGNGK